MNDASEIAAAQARVVELFRAEPHKSFSTKKVSGRLADGLRCTATMDSYTAVMDMDPVIGGGGTGPSPGFYIRAGLVGCVAIGIKLAAAREAIPIEAIDVDVEMDFDDGAMLGMATNSAAPLETRIKVRITSSAPWDQVSAMVDRAMEADPYYVALKEPQAVKLTLSRG